MDITEPIFLVGFPRSGTTFLQSLLATQSSIVSFPETHFYTVLTGHLSLENGLIQVRDYNDVIERAERMMGLAEDSMRYERLFADHPEGFQSVELFRSLLHELSQAYNLPLPDDDHRLLEKTPMHILHMPRILSDFPDARFIHITRHPVHAISSHVTKLSRREHPISELIKEFAQTLEKATDLQRSHPERYFRLSYEQLVGDTEMQMAELMSWLGLRFHPERLAEHTKKAEDLVLPYETWKSRNTGKSEIVEAEIADLGWREVATIQLLLEKEMKELEYPFIRPLFQMMYRWKNA